MSKNKFSKAHFEESRYEESTGTYIRNNVNIKFMTTK